MNSRTTGAVLALTIGAIALFAGSAAAATPLPVNGGWQEFSWVGSGPVVDAPFTFTSNKTTILRITDIEDTGDQFALMDGNKKLGDTNLVKRGGPSVGNPNKAYASKEFSHGTWTLPPGTHSIRVSVLPNSFGDGDFDIRVDTLKAGK